MFRYLALLWNAESEQILATAEDLERRIQAMSPSWGVVLRGVGVSVFMADGSRHLNARMLFSGGGVIFGEIFARLNPLDGDGPADPAKFGPKETQEVIESQGRILASRYWGNYVAFILDANRRARYIFKDPCGSLPCYFAEHGGVQLIFSCLGDCCELGLRFKVNWVFVRARVVSGLLDLCAQSFKEISSVHRGECIRFGRLGTVESRSQYWHPSNFLAGTADAIVEPNIARTVLRATMLSCTHSMAARHSSVLAQVSGGLDSSVVLGCLGELSSRPDITCYTAYIPDSVCDERRWARCAVRSKGHRHIEVPLAPEKLIYKTLSALAPSVEPASYFTHWQRSPVERNLAARYGATAVFTGEGGDSAFCATSYIFAVDHCLRRYGLGLRTLRTAVGVATRRDRTVWNVLGKALGREVFGIGARDDRRRLAPFCRLVSEDARRSMIAEASMSSAWLDGISWETSLRMGPLAFAPSFYDLSTSHHNSAPNMVSPLCAQPVFEICARIPVDVHFDGGRIRGLARRAFANEVPEPILRRQWKDRPLLQLGEVIQLNLPFIREHLLEGALMKEQILNRAAVEQALRSGPSSSTAIGSEILSHLDLELWIRSSA
jgi:asparagine synthase (glutamine-hydrolysing)